MPSNDWINKLEKLIYEKADASTALETALGVDDANGKRIHDKFAVADSDRGPGGTDSDTFIYPRVTYRVEAADYSDDLNAAKAVNLFFDIWSQADSKTEANNIHREVEKLFKSATSNSSIKMGAATQDFLASMREPDTRILHIACRYSATAVELT